MGLSHTFATGLPAPWSTFQGLVHGGQVAGPLTPPTVAPVLSVSAELGSNTANLTWTASNKASSAGFGYEIEVNINSAGWGAVTTTTGLSYNYTASSPAGETYAFRITPYNDAGEGPSSNAASVILPGECDAPVLTGPTPPTSGAFTLTWTEPTGAVFDSYRLYRSDDEFGTYSLEDTIGAEPSPSYAAGLTGWWKVAAYQSTTLTEGPLSNAFYGEIVIPSATTRKLQDGTTRTLQNSTSRTLND